MALHAKKGIRLQRHKAPFRSIAVMIPNCAHIAEVTGSFSVILISHIYCVSIKWFINSFFFDLFYWLKLSCIYNRYNCFSVLHPGDFLPRGIWVQYPSKENDPHVQAVLRATVPAGPLWLWDESCPNLLWSWLGQSITMTHVHSII